MKRMTEVRSQNIGEPDHLRFKGFYSEKNKKPLESFKRITGYVLRINYKETEKEERKLIKEIIAIIQVRDDTLTKVIAMDMCEKTRTEKDAENW